MTARTLRHSRAGKPCARCSGSMMATWDKMLGELLSCLLCGYEESPPPPAEIHQRELDTRLIAEACPAGRHDYELTRWQDFRGEYCDQCRAEAREAKYEERAREKARQDAAVARRERTG